MKIKKNRKYYIVIPILLVAIISLIVTIIVIIVNKNTKPPEVAKAPETIIDEEELTEEIIATTKQTLAETASVEILGYRQMEDDDGIHDVVGVRVTNSGTETTSLAIVVAAKDEEGNVLDKSSLYAEGINPGQTYDFNLFVFTTLTPEQLKTAKYEVYKANTYEAPTITE